MSPMSMPGDARNWVSELTGRVSDAARKWTDPREKQLRKTRRARRRATRYGGLSVISGAGTGALALASAPDWTVIAGGGATALFAVPAVFAWQKFRENRAAPLPPQRPVRRFQPHHGSAVHGAMTRLSAAEQSLYRLVLVLEQSAAIPAGEANKIFECAISAGDSLERAAKNVAGMEYARARMHTAGDRSGAAADLASPIRMLGEHVTAGVEEIEELTATAARMTDAALGMARTGMYLGLDQQREHLLDVTERVAGLTLALHELRDIDRAYEVPGPAPETMKVADRGRPRTSPDIRASGLT